MKRRVYHRPNLDYFEYPIIYTQPCGWRTYIFLPQVSDVIPRKRSVTVGIETLTAVPGYHWEFFVKPAVNLKYGYHSVYARA